MPRNIWMSIGQFSGLFASLFTGKKIRKTLFNIALAIIGAVTWAWLASLFDYLSMPGVSQLNERDMLIDVIGSASLFIIFQALTQSAD